MGEGHARPKPWCNTARYGISLILMQRYPTLLSLQFVCCLHAEPCNFVALWDLGAILSPPCLQPRKQGWSTARFSFTATENSCLFATKCSSAGPPPSWAGAIQQSRHLQHQDFIHRQKKTHFFFHFAKPKYMTQGFRRGVKAMFQQLFNVAVHDRDVPIKLILGLPALATCP